MICVATYIVLGVLLALIFNKKINKSHTQTKQIFNSAKESKQVYIALVSYVVIFWPSVIILFLLEKLE